MSADADFDKNHAKSPGNDASSRRKRRRRRRNRRPGEDGVAEVAPRAPRSSGGGRPGSKDDNAPSVTLPRTGRVPRFRLAVHPSKERPASAQARRRRLSRAEMEALAGYLDRLPDSLLSNLYRGMGGQPGRVTSKDRMIQLAVRAIAQGSRLSNLVRTLHQRDRQALAILVQCGGLAQIEEFKAELVLSLGGHEREWTKVLANLSDRGLIASTEVRDNHSFVLVPEPLLEHLVAHLREDLTLPDFDHEDVRVLNEQPFSPPLEFSVVTLTTYIDQHPPRLTQRHEIFKVHKDEMDQFFSQLWEADSELFSFHIEFLMTHGMVELKGDRLSVNRAVVEEWLQLDSGDQLDLVFQSLDKRFPLAEWVLWAVHDAGGTWVPERPLSALYRRWRRGEEWRERFHKGQWASPRSAQREGYTFTPLLNCGMLELGQWGQEKFYRLTPRAQRLLEPEPTEESFSQFYLTPSFEIMAPAGMSPVQFFRVGELAELTACDRANTYKITEVTIEQALEKGWRRDDVVEFLRDSSQIGLPENVETTLRGWMGHHGDVEFHDVMLLTVHRSQIRALESCRALKPYLLHRFVPGMYAVDKTRLDQLNQVLIANGFSPTPKTRRYPDDPSQVEARERLLDMVNDARTAREDLLTAAHSADSDPEQLQLVAGAGHRGRARKKKGELPPRLSADEVRELCEKAAKTGQQLKVLYVSRDNTRNVLKLAPERVAVNSAGQHVLVARDLAKDARLSYQLAQIERAALLEA